MRRALPLLLIAATLGARAEVVDRIAVSVAGQVVTLGDIKRQIRLGAFLNKEPLDLSEANLRRVAGLLVDQALIRREAELSRYAPPTHAEVTEAMKEYAAALGLDFAGLLELARKQGFSEQETRELASVRIMVVRFIDYRFRPGVQLGEADVNRYYTDVFLPQFRARVQGQEPPALDEVRERIIDILNTQLATEASTQWLEQARKVARIRYHEEAFK